MQTRVRVTPAVRVVTAPWDDDDDARLTCREDALQPSRNGIWRTQNCVVDAHLERGGNTLRSLPVEGWLARRWTERRSPAPDPQIPWIALGDSHIRTVWWSVVRGTEEESSGVRNRRRSTLGTHKTNTATAILRRRTISCATDHARKQHENRARIIDTLPRDPLFLCTPLFALIHPLVRKRHVRIIRRKMIRI